MTSTSNVNDERLVIKEDKDGETWDVFFQASVLTPQQDWSQIEGEGSTSVWLDQTMVHSANHLCDAIRHGREWAAGSGYKAGPLRPLFCNSLEIKLRRP